MIAARLRMRAVGALAALALVGAAAACSSGAAAAPAGATTLSIAGHKAVVLGTGTTAVVLLHGLTTHKEAWYPLMPKLAAAGDRAIAYDYDSSKSADVAEIVAWARVHGAARIVLAGSSLGAQHALETADTLHVAAVITFSSEVERSVHEPLLAIASRGDGTTASIAADNVSHAAHGSKLVVVNGSTHGIDLVHPHPEVMATVTAWLAHTLGGP